MRRNLAGLIGVWLMAQGAAQAADLSFRPAQGLPRIHTSVDSLQERRWKHIVKQGIDISCGSATLATILQYQFGEQVDESALIRTILNNVKAEDVRQRGGFSLLDLKRAATGLGYHVQGYKLPLEALAQMGAPAIVALTVRGRKHFVVFRGMVGDRVVLADPAFGNILLKADDFQAFWQGVALVLKKDGKERAPSRLSVHQDDLTTTQIQDSMHSKLGRDAVVYSVMGPDEF